MPASSNGIVFRRSIAASGDNRSRRTSSSTSSTASRFISCGCPTLAGFARVGKFVLRARSVAQPYRFLHHRLQRDAVLLRDTPAIFIFGGAIGEFAVQVAELHPHLAP